MGVGLIPFSSCCSVSVPRARKLQNSFKKSEFGVRETEYLLKVSEISRGRNVRFYSAGENKGHPLQCRHFLFFSSLTAVVRTPTAVFSVSGKSAHPCLIPDFSAKMSSFSPLSIMLAVGLL